MNKKPFQQRTFAETLTAYCKRAGYPLWDGNQVHGHELARRLQTSQPNVHRWLNENVNPSFKLQKHLAETLNLTISQLLGSEPIPGIDTPEDKLLELPAHITLKIPLISEIQAGTWMEAVDNYHVGDGEDWIVTTSKVSPKSFALKVTGDSMNNPNGTPSIPEGSIVIIDPEATPQNGKIVVAKLPDTNEAMLKRLVIDGPNRYLKPLNPEYRTIPINEDCIIIGVAKQILQDL